MSVEVTTDLSAILKRVKKGKQMLKEQVTEAVIVYGNVYCPEDTGDLQRSATSASRPKDGEAIWDKEYAAENYYGVNRNFSKDRNPNAQAMWAEVGVTNHKEDIDATAQKAFERGMG